MGMSLACGAATCTDGYGEMTMDLRSPTAVYPGRRKLSRYFIAQAVLIAASLYVCIWSSVTPPAEVGAISGILPAVPILPISTGLLALVVGSVWGSIGYRLLVESPALTITDAGLDDNCSFLACGVGLIRWQDMQAVYVVRYSNGAAPIRIKRTFLIVCLRDEKSFFAGRSVAIRWLHHVFTFLMVSPQIFIQQYMLSGTADQVWGSLQDHYETYTSGGYDAAAVPAGLTPLHRHGDTGRSL
jgi:hypothetical protein